MKQRQTVPKPLAIAILAILFVVISATQVQAQSQARDHAKLQKSVEWENYQANWKKVELEKAKEIRKIEKERAKEDKDRRKFFAKLERIKGSE